jgi:hypothetical protein
MRAELISSRCRHVSRWRTRLCAHAPPCRR